MQPYKLDFITKLLAELSKIKVFKWPLFISYRPNSFAIKGYHTREILKLVKPGDILVRSFNNYLDNYTIPGTFTQVGFYLSEVNEQHLKKFANIEQHDFKLSRQMIIHSIGGKVILEDLIDFCRCDALAVMRFPRQIKLLQEIPTALIDYFNDPTASSKLTKTIIEEPSVKKNWLAKFKRNKDRESEDISTEENDEIKYDANSIALAKAENNIVQHLKNGKIVEFEKIFKILYRLAIKELNTIREHNFGIEPFYTTSSTDLVYFITKSICWNYAIIPETDKVLFKNRSVILPDAFVDGDLEEVWKKV
ncbi:MAG TPA: hypothetical protein ENK59_01455 [Thioploca sp.]|nr:hypothetical protein [Thioploca sp.]